MKINMLVLCIATICAVSRISAFQYFEENSVKSQEKAALYQQLAAFEEQKKAEIDAYALLSKDEKKRAWQEHEKKIAQLSEQIEKQKSAITNVYREELFWKVATFFGGVALGGLLGYAAFAAPIVPQTKESLQMLPPKTQPLASPLEMPKVPVPSSMSKVNNVVVQALEPQQYKPLQWNEFFPKENGFPESQPESAPVMAKKLTPEEKALYELRYKNYGIWAGWTAYSTTALLLAGGSVAWPVELAAFGIAALCGERALFYKRKLAQSE